MRFPCLALSVGGLFAPAAAPNLEHFFPVTVQVGTTNHLLALGAFDPWPVQLTADSPGILFTAETNKAKFTAVVSPETPLGPHLIWAFNEAGASSPRFLIVTPEAAVAEVEPNDDFRKPQWITNFPAHVNGRLEKNGDVDCFGVTLTAGQTLVAAVEAYTLMTGVDALLRLTDSRGLQLAWNHDDGRTLDPLLAWTAPVAGTYIVQVMGFIYPAGSDVRLHGSEKTVYRLHLHTGPYVHHTVPLGIQRQARTALHLVGWNLGALADHPFDYDAPALSAEETTQRLMIPGVENSVKVLVGEGPELVEIEPNDALTNAPVLLIPCAVTGVIDPANDRDRYAFDARKDERLLFSVQSAALGFPLDPWLEIQDPAGKTLVTVDDTNGADPEVTWTSPSEGRFQVVIGNRFHRGGPDHRYRLSVLRPSPEFRATVAAPTLTLQQGTTNEVKLTVTRNHGHTNRVIAAFKGLPEGVSAAPMEAPEKSGDLTLKLIAATNAPLFSGRVQAVVRGDFGERPAWFELVTAGENNGVPQGFKELVIPRTDQLWLTIARPGTNTVLEKK